MTPEETTKLAALTATRVQLAKNIERARGLVGNGAEAAYAAAFQREWEYAQSVGLRGFMRPKKKWSKL